MEALELTLKKRHALALERRRLDDEITLIDGALNDFLDERGVEADSAGLYTIKRVASARHTLDRQRLVELGVLPEIITAATKTTSFTSLRVAFGGETTPPTGVKGQ